MTTTKRQQHIAARLEKLATENRGRLTAELVVADARAELSPLHGEFEWDDTKAASAHRLNQARQLIRQVRIIVSENHVSVPVIAYVRDPSAARDEQGYIAVPQLRTEMDLAREALQYEVERAMAALARAREVARALGLAEELNSMRETLIAIRARLAAAA